MRAFGVNDLLWKLDSVSLGGNAMPRLREASLEIREGVTAVIGHSGAGKTSLLNLLVGFEKPDRGGIAAPRSFFWVPQNNGLWPQHTVREHLEIVSPPHENLRSEPTGGRCCAARRAACAAVRDTSPDQPRQTAPAHHPAFCSASLCPTGP